ncbi:MAG: SRPBCC family protein [Acidobacteriota bacterium]|nr:SRPBCC family protein [Acidobacteriota bacterium]
MRPARWRGAWVVRAPREKVYEVMTDFEGWPKLFPEMVKSIRVVSRTDATAVLEGDFELMGRRGRGLMNIRLSPPAGYDADNSSEELGSERETLRFEVVPEGTLYRWAVDARPRGFFNLLLGKLFGFYVRRFYERTLISPLRKALEK